MTRFSIKILIFCIALTGIVFSIIKVYSLPTEKNNFKNYETESNLFFIDKDQKYDFVFMGISHARNFSRHKNHLRTEEILGGRLLNLGRGGGLVGASGEHAYLRYFYSKGNETKKLVYVISPPMLYSEKLEQNSNVFVNEPFKIKFFFQYLSSRGTNVPEQLYYFLHSKLEARWKKMKPWSADSMTRIITSIDTVAINNGMHLAYPNGLDEEVYKRGIKLLKKSLQLANSKGTEVIVIFTPTLFGHWPGHDSIMVSLNNIQDEVPFKIYDYSETIQDPQLFYDHHHLNTKGIVIFLEEQLKPDLIYD